MTRFFRHPPDSIQVPLATDETGMTGRECPNTDCLGYFKVQFGTGLPGQVPCHCPYCGHVAAHDQFFTQEQIKYAQSVAVRHFTKVVAKELKKLEFNHPARGPFGIGISMKFKEGMPPPIRYYREKQLETEVICDKCTLRYAIYGVFAYCPDCGTHNSAQILAKNLDLAGKELDLANQVESSDLKEHLIADALENVVSAFDGFGREVCRVHAAKASDPKQAENMSFQNLRGAEGRIQKLFAVSLQSMLDAGLWDLAIRCFNKRHLLAHNMGVVDEKYLAATNDKTAVIGRKVRIEPDDVRSLIAVARQLGGDLAAALAGKP